jgi:phage tail protein X
MTINSLISMLFALWFMRATPAAVPVQCPQSQQLNTQSCSASGYVIPGFPTRNTWERLDDTPDIFYGRAVHYHPGIMWSTAKYRGFSQEYLEQFDCLGSGFFINDVGRVAWMLHEGETYRCLIVDNARPRDLWNTVVLAREAIEVNYTFYRDVLQESELDYPIVLIAYQVEEPTPEEWNTAERLDTYLKDKWVMSYHGEPHGFVRVIEDQTTEYQISEDKPVWKKIPGGLWGTDENGDMLADEVPTVQYMEHVVVYGDTVSQIAYDFYGRTTPSLWELIYEANDNISPTSLKVGSVLQIPIYKQID